MLAARMATGTTLGLAVLGTLLFDEVWAPVYPLWFILTALLQGAAVLELVALLRLTSAKPSGNTAFAGTLAVLAANWIPHLLRAVSDARAATIPEAYDPLEAIYVLAWPMMTFAAVVMMAFVTQSAQYERPGATMATIAGTVLAVAYVGLLGSFVVQARWLAGPHHGALPLIFFVATAKGADIGAYTFGRVAGRHKLWPRLSPSKTVEGAMGGLLSGIAAAMGVSAVARVVLGQPGLDWSEAAGYGVLVGSAAQLGDLMESMIKRDCERKDASDVLPGFGGVLDVLDSLVFAGPVAYGYWLILGT